MEKTSIALYGFAERNAALLMTVRAEEGIDLVKKYLEKTELPGQELAAKIVGKRVIIERSEGGDGGGKLDGNPGNSGKTRQKG